MSDAGSLADLLPQLATSRPDSTALNFAGEQTTWSELVAAVELVAAALRVTGLGAGERVAISLGSTLNFVTAFHGVLRAGLVAVPVNPGYTARERAHMLRDSGARVLITRVDALPAVRQLREQLPALAYLWVVGNELEDRVDRGHPDRCGPVAGAAVSHRADGRVRFGTAGTGCAAACWTAPESTSSRGTA